MEHTKQGIFNRLVRLEVSPGEIRRRLVLTTDEFNSMFEIHKYELEQYSKMLFDNKQQVAQLWIDIRLKVEELRDERCMIRRAAINDDLQHLIEKYANACIFEEPTKWKTNEKHETPTVGTVQTEVPQKRTWGRTT